MAPLDRLERLTDLVLVLLNSQRPITLEEIAGEVPGYPAAHDARRQAFERDKRLLREEGIPVLTEPVGGHEQYGYRIDPEGFYLPDLRLQPDEQAALHLAVAGVHLGDPSGRDALLKLGATGLSEARPVASLVPPPALVPLFDAVRQRAAVAFDYRGERRRVAPASLRFRDGRWYLVGWDLERRAPRTFRVDRVDGRPLADEPGSGPVPDGFDAAAEVPEEPWRGAEGDRAEVLLWVDHVEGPRVVEEVGAGAVRERRADGSVVLQLGVSSQTALRSWVLGLLDHAELVEPESVRAAWVSWLRQVAAGQSVAALDALLSDEPVMDATTPGTPAADSQGADG
ncbi:MAG TPA: WYL domain-containing protein, partial [Acidimicrobiales bacterium]|nr:WYL domain-containing protein [Acidimicrobiales bacterium]